MNTRNIIIASLVLLAGCFAEPASRSGTSLPASAEANQAGVYGYSLRDAAASQILDEHDRNGVVLGTLEVNHLDGTTTQTWTDADRTVWQVSTATGLLSRNGTTLGNDPQLLELPGVRDEVRAAMAARHDLDVYLYGEADPFAVHGAEDTAARTACGITIDIGCTTSLICAAMGGDFSCGLFVTRCCF